VRTAIIGVGNVGCALARAFTTAGHVVVLSARTPGHAEKVADELKVAAAGSNREAVRDADLVVLAVPANAVATVLEDGVPAHLSLNARNGWPWQSEWKLLGPTT
jgi:predicted dinucleotide-binding enzyme